MNYLREAEEAKALRKCLEDEDMDGARPGHIIALAKDTFPNSS